VNAVKIFQMYHLPIVSDLHAIIAILVIVGLETLFYT